MSEKLNDNNGIIHDRKEKGLNDLQWSTNKGNNTITELRTILQRESQNS